MEHRDYEAFEHLAQSLHFGHTARVLGMSASALTRRIQGIEEEVGQLLLHRESKDIRLTAAGRIFRQFARSQLDQLEELRNELRQEEESPSGELHIACTVTACHTVLPRLLARLRREYPGVTLRLITQDAARSLLQLEGGEVDLAVVPAEPEGLDPLASVVLGRTNLCLIAPRHDASIEASLNRSPPALSELPYVAPLGGLERERLLNWPALEGKKPRIVAEVRGNEGIIAMVSLGSGVALVPELVLESSPLKDTVRRVEGLSLPPGYDVALCTRKRSLSRRVVRVFWDLVDRQQAGC